MQLKSVLKSSYLKIILLTTLICSTCMFYYIANKKSSKEIIFQMKSSSNPESIYEITQVTPNSKYVKSLVFYSDIDGLHCAVFSQDFFGYRLLGISGNLSTEQDSDTKHSRLYSSLQNGKNGAICWGILYDKSISNVTVENNNASIVYLGDNKLWYYLGSYEMDYKNVYFD